MKISDLRKLVKIANRLDATGYERLADELDAIVREAAHDPNDPNDPRNYDSSAAYISYRPEPEYNPDDYCHIHPTVRLSRDRSGFYACDECEWERRQRQREVAQATPPQATPKREPGIPYEYNSETVRDVFKMLENNKRLSESEDGQAILKLLQIQGTDWRASDLFDIYAINVSFGSDPSWSLDYNEEFKKAILNIANSF
jgi:hypothetical protein